MRRLACIYLPAFPLQMEVLERPELAGKAVVVLGGGDRPEVLACSRAAFQAGVRPGMGPSQARNRVADLIVTIGAPRRWRDEVGLLAEEIGSLGARVDLTEALRGDMVVSHPVIYLEVPAGQRSDRFGRRLLDLVAARGHSGRVGIAGDRFTARVAARMRGDSPVVVVTRGSAAEFLAPLPIELLPLRDEVRALLRAAGVHTLGEFAALPPPSAECRAAGAVDYQALARGNGPSELYPAAPLPARLPARPAPARTRRGDDRRQLVLAS